MITLKTLGIAQPTREHLSMLKQYASVSDNSRDALLKTLLVQAFKIVQETSDKTLLPSKLELTVSERHQAYDDMVRLYQCPDEIISVTDGDGVALDYSRSGRILHCLPWTDTVVVTYTTKPSLAEADTLLVVVLQYATALYDGADTATLNSILAQC